MRAGSKASRWPGHMGRVQGVNGHAGGTAVGMKVRNTPALT